MALINVTPDQMDEVLDLFDRLVQLVVLNTVNGIFKLS